MSQRWRRRDVLRTLSASGLAAGFAGRSWNLAADQAPSLPAPSIKAPADAADCHHHIYDARFPADPRAVLHPPDALVEDFRRMQQRIGTSRSVIVQPSTYGTDNRCTLAALAAMGSSARAIAVVTDAVTDAELKRLASLGVKGIRFNLIQAGATTAEMIEPLAKRIAPMGLHIQINAAADRLLEILPMLERLPTPLVFDHLAHIPQPDGPAHPLFGKMRALLDKGRTWVKLSGAYIDSKIGAPTYADATAVARAYVKAAPERLVWGSDWPHPGVPNNKPDDALLLDLLAVWAPDEKTRNRILIDNPATLYGF
jgi:D-galactarolactone isomerase